MAMYAFSTTPLIHLLKDDGIKWASYVDNATAGGSLKAGSGSGATTLMNFLVISYLNAVADLGGIQGCEWTPLWTVVNYYS